MKRLLVLFAIIGWHSLIYAQVRPYEFRLGAVRVSADAKRIVIHADRDVGIDIFMGGHMWPRLSLDEEGRIYAGATVIDPLTGRLESPRLTVDANETVQLLPSGMRLMAAPKGFRIQQQDRTCSFSRGQLGLSGGRSAIDDLQSGYLVVSVSNNKILALSTQLNKAGNIAGYRVSKIDLSSCSVKPVSLARTDMFVELGGSSRGGWWLTGSIEQSLLRSPDGIRWHSVPLPANVHGLVSSYIVDDMEIWLAASNADDYLGDGDPELLFSDNGGRAWRTIRQNDPYLRRLPKGWLEGQQRIGVPVSQSTQK